MRALSIEAGGGGGEGEEEEEACVLVPLSFLFFFHLFREVKIIFRFFFFQNLDLEESSLCFEKNECFLFLD